MSGFDLGAVEWVRLSFVDVFGTSNSMQIPAARMPEVLERGAMFDGSALEGRARHLESDMLLRPDPATLVDLGDGVARAICTVHSPDGARWSADPRYALESLLADAGELIDGVTIGAELEFYLLEGSGAPLDTAGYFDEPESPGSVLVRSAAQRLLSCGIRIDAWHHEAGPGQYELDLAALAPLRLADAIVLTKQLVRELARSQGFTATFMPRPFDDQPGSGLHLHQRMPESLVDDTGELGARARGFVAGQLAHARGLCAIAAPTVNSYKRLHAGPEAPSAIVWAHMNRAALIRVSSYRGTDASIEYRGADPSANPYLLIAGLIATGLEGIEQDLALPGRAEEVAGGYDSVRSELLIEPLPRNLDDALDAMLSDDVIVDAFDDQLLGRLVDGRRAEAQAYGALVTGWERARYLDGA